MGEHGGGKGFAGLASQMGLLLQGNLFHWYVAETMKSLGMKQLLKGAGEVLYLRLIKHFAFAKDGYISKSLAATRGTMVCGLR